MKARVYQHAGGYDIVNSAGRLFRVVPSAQAYVVKDCGRVTDKWIPSGRLCRQIPNPIKKLFFKLNKKVNDEQAINH